MLTRSCTEPLETNTPSAIIRKSFAPTPTEQLIELQKAEIKRLRGMLRGKLPDASRHYYPCVNKVTAGNPLADSVRDQASSSAMASTYVNRPAFDFTRSLSLPAEMHVMQSTAKQRSADSSSFNVFRRSSDVVPVEHIEVKLQHGEHDDVGSSSGWQDDLTVGSSFGACQD
jgi:hypothetical protein